MPASNLIQFKRGTMQALEALMTNKSGIDGTFYLTIDDDATGTNNPSKSSRLFVGRADGSIVPVNQGIITVSNINQLTDGITGKWHAGDYAYVTGSNILAIYDGQNWKQINVVGDDTYLADLSLAVANNQTTGYVDITTQTQLNDHPADQSIDQTQSVTFSMVGGDGVTVSVDANNDKLIHIDGDPYALSSAAAASNATTINLGHGANGATSAGSIAVSSADADHVHITGSANQIVIDAVANDELTIQPTANDGDGFGIQVSDTYGNSVSDTLDPVIAYGEDGDQEAHFVNGTATLNVYTKAEVDEIKRTLNSMTYKGTVGTNGSAATDIATLVAADQSGVTQLSNGDVFKAKNDLAIGASLSATNSAVTAHEGDLLIIQGAENDDGKIPSANVKIDVVPSGDDIDTSYTGEAITHGWKIDKFQGAGDDLGSIQLAEGTAISLTDDSTVLSPNKKITVAHANVNANAITAAGSTAGVTKSSGQTATFTAVTGMSVNEQGHVTNVTTSTLSLPTESNADLNALTNTISVAQNATNTHSNAPGQKNAVTVKTTAQMTKNDGTSGQAQEDSFTVSSDNLTISADGTNKDIKFNFVWESF